MKERDYIACWGGVSARGCLPAGGLSARGVSACWGGVSACWGGVSAGEYLPARVVSGKGVSGSPLWTELLTHACENITFPQLRLRTIKNIEEIHNVAKVRQFGQVKLLNYNQNLHRVAD